MNNLTPVVKIIPLRKKVALSREFSKHAQNLHKEHAIRKYLRKKSFKGDAKDNPRNFEGFDLRQASRIRSLYVIQSLILAGILAIVAVLAIPSLRTTAIQALNANGINILNSEGTTSTANQNNGQNTSQNNNQGNNQANSNSDSNGDSAYSDGSNASDGNSSSSSDGSTSDQNTSNDTKVSSALRSAILHTYGVSSFSEIQETGALEGISEIHSITEVNANKLTVRLNLTHSNTNRQAVRAIANRLLEIARANDVQAITIIVITIDSYFLEQATSGGS